MRKELDDKLCAKYPKIFARRGMTKFESCMYWGFACDDGWYNIINDLCYAIQNYLDYTQEVPQVVATQVKEKFGGLRFYVEGGNEITHDLINTAELLSYKTCEKCGSMNEVTNTIGWIKYLCKDCMDQHNAEKLKAK